MILKELLGLGQTRINEAFSKEIVDKYTPVIRAMNVLGIKFTEKPGYWVDIKARVSESKLEELEEKIAFKLPVYSADDVFGRPKRSSDSEAIDGIFPQFDAKLPKEPIFVLEIGDDDHGSHRYLCDGTGASTFIRFWAKIV